MWRPETPLVVLILRGSRVSASRRAPPAPAPAPRPRRCRRAGCAARARDARCSAAAAAPRAPPSANPPSGPISTLTGSGPAMPPPRAAASAATGSFTSASSSQNTSRRSGHPVANERLELDRLGDLRDVEDAALLGGLDGVRAHPRQIDALGLGVPRDHRLQPRDAHLDRLLHHVVEARVLERREQVVQIAGRGLLAHALGDVQPHRLLARTRQGARATRRRGR